MTNPSGAHGRHFLADFIICTYEVPADAWTHPTLAITRNEYGQAQMRFFKVSVIDSPVGIVTQINTEDSNADLGLAGAVEAFDSIAPSASG